MKYNKPEVVALAVAADAIQSSSIKNPPLVTETVSPFTVATSAAYEADE